MGTFVYFEPMRKALLDSLIWRGVYFASTLLLNVCIARVYEARQSGWIYFISNNFYLVLLVAGLSLDAGMTFFSSARKIPDNRLAFFSFCWSCVVGLVSLVCTIIFTKSKVATSDSGFLLIAGLAYSMGNVLCNYFTSLFYARQNFRLANIYMSSVNFIFIALLLLNSYLHLFSNPQFLYVYFMQFLLQGLGLALIYRSLYLAGEKWELPLMPELKLLMNYSLVALAANITGYLINRVDYFFVEPWCSPKSLGNYVQVSKMGQLLLILPTIVASAIYPLASQGKTAEVSSLITRLFVPVLLVFVLIIIVSVLVSNQLFLLVFGPTFNEMYAPFLWLLPGIFFMSLHILFGAYFGGINKPLYNFISATVGLVVVLAGDILFIKPYGIVAAAIVSTVGYATTCAVSFAFFRSSTGLRLVDMVNRKTLSPSYYYSLFYKASTPVS